MNGTLHGLHKHTADNFIVVIALVPVVILPLIIIYYCYYKDCKVQALMKMCSELTILSHLILMIVLGETSCYSPDYRSGSWV